MRILHDMCDFPCLAEEYRISDARRLEDNKRAVLCCRLRKGDSCGGDAIKKEYADVLELGSKGLGNREQLRLVARITSAARRTPPRKGMGHPAFAILGDPMHDDGGTAI